MTISPTYAWIGKEMLITSLLKSTNSSNPNKSPTNSIVGGQHTNKKKKGQEAMISFFFIINLMSWMTSWNVGGILVGGRLNGYKRLIKNFHLVLFYLMNTKLSSDFFQDLSHSHKLRLFLVEDSVNNFGWGYGGKTLIK